MTLRPVDAGDRERVFHWANDPGTRAASFSTEPISWETHAAWFDRTIADPGCRWYMAVCEGTPVGHVRFDTSRGHTLVSINTAPSERGKGRGASALGLACERFFEDTQNSVIHAEIKPGNTTSVKTFEKAGFTYERAGSGASGEFAVYALRSGER